VCSCSKNLSAWHSFKYLFIWKIAYQLTSFLQHIITVIVLFESGNMAHTQTHKDIQTDRQTDRISGPCSYCCLICPSAVFLRIQSSFAQGSFPVRKRTGTLRIWRAREREPIWGSGGGAPSGVQGQTPWSGGRSPLKLKAFYCRREQICHSHLSETYILQLYAEKDRNGVPVIKKKNRNGVPVRSGSKRTLLLLLVAVFIEILSSLIRYC